MLRRFVLTLILLSHSATAMELDLLHRLRIHSDDYRYGGLSGIETRDNGRLVFLLSDRGNVFRLDLERPLEASHLQAAFYAFVGGDSEGLAISAENQWFISTEIPAQVNSAWWFCSPIHPDFIDLVGNRGLEALALSDALYALPEQPIRDTFPIYRFAENAWDIVGELPPSDGFVPVGADFGPEGRLWILERDFSIWGFRNRIRVWTPEQTRTVLLTKYAEYDNLEGISVWQNDAGETRITLVSDDNFVPFLRSELVEYVLRD